MELGTRAGDDTVKLLYTPNFKSRIAKALNIDNNHPQTNIMTSPDSNYILTGQSCPPYQQGSLLILDSTSLSTIRTIPIGMSSVIRVLWKTKVNQLVTCTHKGEIHVLYCSRASIIEITSI